MPNMDLDQDWGCADRPAAMRFANALIASDDPRVRGEGYALRSVLRFDGSDVYMGLTAGMFRAYWFVALPMGIVYDVMRLPVQVWNELQVSDEDMELASRDMDAARNLGVTAEREGLGSLRLFGRYYLPIDRTEYYVAGEVER